MSIDKLLITLFGLAGIASTYWFFLMKKEKVIAIASKTGETDNPSEVTITVEGGYTPEAISIPKAQTTIINFIRKDPTSCLEEVVIPDFKIKKYLPLNQKVSVEITPQKEGEYGFACGMNMYHGKIIVT